MGSHRFTPIQAPSHPVPLSPIQALSSVPSRLHHGAVSGMGPDEPMDHDHHHLAWLCLLPPDSLRSPQKPARPYMGVCPAQDLACCPSQNLWKMGSGDRMYWWHWE